ncbi:MAG: glycosyltransferase [Patescibacteria group bacterium]|jgi:colanic acid/amylovoran biosynthesis glycosyltransferase
MKEKKILIICNRFPNISETFIRSQIDFLLTVSSNVHIFACGRKVNNYLLNKYEHVFGLKSNTQKILFFPFYFFNYIFKNPVLVFKSLNIFKYGKDALYLKLFYAVIFFYKKKYDIIITHFGRSGNVGAFIKKNIIPDVKLLSVFHGADIREGIKKQGKIYSNLFNIANNIIAISSYNNYYLKKWGARNIVKLHNGIDIDYYKETRRQGDKEIVILSVGRLVWEKGYISALEVVKKVIKNNPNLKINYIIVGEGIMRKKLEKYILENNLRENIILAGAKKVNEVLDYYLNTDIFLLTSVAEALPTVILEASACALPVVATNVGSISEEVEDCYSGFLIPVNNTLELYNKLNILIKDKQKRIEFGKHGREIMCKKFNKNKLNEELLKLIQ